MKKRIAFLLLVGLGIIGITCAKKEEPKSEKALPAVGVKVEALKATPVEDTYEAVGTVRSETTVSLSSRVMGQILAIHVREGDRVQLGQLLIEIDDREAGAQLRKARAGLKEAEEMIAEVDRNIKAAESTQTVAETHQGLAASTLQRYQALLERKSVSPQEFDEVKARYQVSTAEVERAREVIQSIRAKREQVLARIEQGRADITQAEIMAGYARVRSPMNGIVTLKQAEPGQLAHPGTTLLTLEDERRYRLEAAVEESMIGKIRLGNKVPVRIDALGSMEWTGKVAEITPLLDPATRSAIVKIQLESKGAAGQKGVLRSGLYGKARFPVGKRETITLPQKAILKQGQLQQVYMADSSNMAHLRLIQLGKAYGDRVEVLSGLREGDRVIIEGMEKLRDGSPVVIQ